MRLCSGHAAGKGWATEGEAERTRYGREKRPGETKTQTKTDKNTCR